jgi:phenylalanyl-tRNA synthetase alpha chain
MEKEYQERNLKIENELKEDLLNSKTLNDLVQVKAKYLGKTGIVSELTKNMRDLSPEERALVGRYATEIRNKVNELLTEFEDKLNNEILNKKLQEEKIDVTLPSNKRERGTIHPFNMIVNEIEDLFVSMGYDVLDGPELETDEYCFQRLNIPLGHPVRDTQDSFYVDVDWLLRTQTSSVQARTMEANQDKGPIRMICPGKTYRRDDDATHSHQFGQFEGLVIDEHITLADLKGTLEIMARKLLGEKTNVRFRPSFFPFTEPSVEVDVSCFKCGGKGCPLCKNTGWIELLGAGMVHPNVLRSNGYDPDKYTGFAFGTGIDRLAMMKYNIPDIRYMYTNDIRFLKQFDRKEYK